MPKQTDSFFFPRHLGSFRLSVDLVARNANFTVVMASVTLGVLTTVLYGNEGFMDRVISSEGSCYVLCFHT